MAYYASAYGVKHYGSEGMKAPGNASSPGDPGAAPSPGGSVTPAPSTPAPPPMAAESDPMGDAIAKLIGSLQSGLNQSGQGTGNPFLDRLKKAGNPMWQYFGQVK